MTCCSCITSYGSERLTGFAPYPSSPPIIQVNNNNKNNKKADQPVVRRAHEEPEELLVPHAAALVTIDLQKPKARCRALEDGLRG